MLEKDLLNALRLRFLVKMLYTNKLICLVAFIICKNFVPPIIEFMRMSYDQYKNVKYGIKIY